MNQTSYYNKSEKQQHLERTGTTINQSPLVIEKIKILTEILRKKQNRRSREAKLERKLTDLHEKTRAAAAPRNPKNGAVSSPLNVEDIIADRIYS